MKILIIDNYDSFTYNLYQQFARVSGGEPLVLANDAVTVDGIRALEFDAIVLSPGPGRPDRLQDFGVCGEVLRELEVPILGVCLGHQGIARFHGARVVRAPEPVHGRTSRIRHTGSALFRGVPQDFTAVRYHSLMVEARLPESLHALAWAEDGTLMALRHRQRPQWGIQFHPESVGTDHGDTLIGNFLHQARTFRIPVRRVTVRARPVESKDRPQPDGTGGAATVDAPLQLRYRELAWRVDPEAAFVHLFGTQPNAFWLGSDLVETQRCRFVYMGAADGPHSQVLRYDVAQRKLTVETATGRRVTDESVFTYLSRELAQRRCQTPDLPFDFNCGFAGYFGYEMKAECGAGLVHRSAVPDAALIFADRLIAFDRLQHRCYALALAPGEEAGACEAWFDAVERALAAAPAVPAWSRRAARTQDRRFSLSRSGQTYLEDVERCLREIRAGESYEICLTNQLHTGPVSCPLDFYRVLRRSNPAPYACYLRFDDVAVVSSSPEQFLRVAPDGRLSARPIKGTAARAAEGQADAAACEALRSNAKDRAENLIVVDLLRNDLGRVCEVGSVQVARLMEIETYATVHQLVSTIDGRLKPGKTAVDALRAAFPGGSMTGAPKKRTLEIIDRLETEARGVYSGTAGFLALNGSADLSIVIRTAVCTAEGTSIGSGGGITALSSPDAEFGEMLLKARALIAALVEVEGGVPAGHDGHLTGAAAACDLRVRETGTCRR